MPFRLLHLITLSLLLQCLSAQSVLQGKHVMWLGTSISQLASYPKQSCQNLGMTCLNHSVGASFVIIRPHHQVLYDYSGYSLSMSVAEKEERYRPCVEDGTIDEHQLNTWKFTSYDRLIFDYIDDIDIIIFDHAYNDYSRSVMQEYEDGIEAVDWSSEDRTTFIGAFNYLYRVIREYKPEVKIAIGGYFQKNCSVVPAGQAVAEVSTWIAQHYGIPLIDTWNYTNIPDGHVPNSQNWINEFNARYGKNYHNMFPDSEGNISYFQQFCPDGTHPSSDLSRHSDHVLDTIFTQLLSERLTPLFSQQQPTLQLNEVMQSNVDGLVAEHDFPDSWVELYNPSNQQLDLRGYYLGDKPSLHDAYQFPSSLVIPPHGHQLVYCDKLGTDLHTPFRLKTDPGHLYLWAPDFSLADSLAYPAMPAPGIAYGRVSDGGSNWAHECVPSPGQPNTGHISEQLLPEPLFSLDSQLLSQSQTLTITLPEADCPAGAQIYWTTNGSEPTADSQHGTRVEIELTQSTVVRAKLMAPDCLCRPSSVRSYIFPIQPHDVPVISLVTDSAYLYSSDFGILSGQTNDPEANFMQRWRRPLYAEALGTDSMRIHQLCETAVGGATSRVYSQKSLKLYAGKRFGKKHFKGQLWPDKPQTDQVKSLMLRNGGSRCMGSRINDAFVQTLFGLHVADLDWQAYQPVVVYINGQYQGIYELRERSDEDNVEANHGLSDDEIWQTSSIYQGPGTYNDLVNLVWSSGTTYHQLEQLLDIDELVNYLAAEAYAGNTDWPRNNIFAWAPTAQGGRWRWILKDLDQFRFYPDNSNFLNYIFCQGPEGEELRSKHYDSAHRIFGQLHQYEEFQHLFIDHLAVYSGDFLRPDYALALFRSQRQQQQAELPLTFQTFHSSALKWATQELDSIDSYIQRRPQQLYQNLTQLYHLGTVIPLTIQADSLLPDPIRINHVPLATGRFDGAWFSDYPLQLSSPSDSHQWRLTITYSDTDIQTIDFEDSLLTLSLSDYRGAKSLHLTLHPSASAIQEVHLDTPPDTQPRRFDLWGRHTVSSPFYILPKSR